MYTIYLFPACETDADCDVNRCWYCMSDGYCRKYDAEYCDKYTCGHGDGDCDGKCPPGLKCGYNNFDKHHPLLAACPSRTNIAEVCVVEGKKKCKAI